MFVGSQRVTARVPGLEDARDPGPQAVVWQAANVAAVDSVDAGYARYGDVIPCALGQNDRAWRPPGPLTGYPPGLTVASLADQAQQWLAYRLVRAPDVVLRATTVRRPVVVDGQRLDARTQHALTIIARAGRPPLDELMVVDARAEYARMPQVFEDPPVSIPRIEDGSIPGPGGRLPIRIYGPRAGDEVLPVLVYFHGGGGVIGSIETHDGLCRILARAVDCLVVSVDYRLGPEHPFPAAPEDALMAYRWVVRNAEGLHADPARVAVGGDSMGGCLSAVVCQLARDSGREQPRAQLLLYPGTDRAATTRSQRLFASGFMLTDSMMKWFTDQYMGGADVHDPRASPLRHPRLDALPPAVVVTAGFDPLRDEGRAYADALREAGGSVRYRCHDGLIHGFAQMTGAVPAARAAVDEAAAELRALLHAS